MQILERNLSIHVRHWGNYFHCIVLFEPPPHNCIGGWYYLELQAREDLKIRSSNLLECSQQVQGQSRDSSPGSLTATSTLLAPMLQYPNHVKPQFKLPRPTAAQSPVQLVCSKSCQSASSRNKADMISNAWTQNKLWHFLRNIFHVYLKKLNVNSSSHFFFYLRSSNPTIDYISLHRDLSKTILRGGANVITACFLGLQLWTPVSGWSLQTVQGPARD